MPDQAEAAQSSIDEPASTTRWAIRGALLGAVAGSAAGAGAGMLVGRRPEALQQVKSAIDGAGRQVALAAAVAAIEVVTARGLRLLTGSGNGQRSQLAKQTAREAGAAAAIAARDAIIPPRRETIGSR